MEVLASRVLVRPADFERSVGFYRDTLGLAVYREFGRDDRTLGVVFFLGGGYLEVSGTGGGPAGDKLQLWWQVRDVDAEHERLRRAGVRILEPPIDKPWGLREMRIADPDGVVVVVVRVPDDHPLRRRTG